jgi:hypothetical protein
VVNEQEARDFGFADFMSVSVTPCGEREILVGEPAVAPERSRPGEALLIVLRQGSCYVPMMLSDVLGGDYATDRDFFYEVAKRALWSFYEKSGLTRWDRDTHQRLGVLPTQTEYEELTDKMLAAALPFSTQVGRGA